MPRTLNPSIRHIREQLGNKGSLTTIAEHKRDFEAERADGPTEALPDALTQGLLKGAKVHWAELVEAAQADIDRAESAAAEAVTAAQAAEVAALEERDTLRDRLGESQATLGERDKSLSTLHTEYDALSKAHQQQSIRLATVTESMKAATVRADERLTQINKANQDLAKADTEQQRLNDRIDTQANDHARETATLREQIADQVARLARAIKTEESLTTELKTVKNHNAELDKNDALLRAEIGRLGGDNHELNDDNSRLKTLCGDLKSKVDVGDHLFAELKQVHAKLIDEKDARIADLTRELAAAKTRKRKPNKKATKSNN